MDRNAVELLTADWLRLDQNPETRQEILALQAANDCAELTTRLSKRVAFGTAGLRAEMKAGNAFLNELVILQTTQGLIKYALETQPEAREMGMVIGYDHRHRSRRFAELSADVARRAGVKVYLFQGLVHTPLVPFAVSKLKAALGVMVTASHNPGKDNGFKVYWSNAVQIIAPHDTGIAAAIRQSLEVAPDAFNVTSDDSTAWKGTEEMKEAYFDMTKSLCRHPSDNAKTPLLFTFTPMHGVGLPFVERLMKDFQFPSSSLSIVAAQAKPDPDFPTVKFPNPEEKGALALAIAHADSVGSTIVLANDPDADRFNAGEKVNGVWKIFTGDQLGTLFGYNAFKNYQSTGRDISKLAMCVSTVSSRMIASIGKKEGFLVRETLTGFKFLGNEALRLEKAGYECWFAYEEAIGFMNGLGIRDKDGVSALAIFCELATQLKKEGKSVSDHLEELYKKYGHFLTANSYFICRDSTKTNRIFTDLRKRFIDPTTGERSLDRLTLGGHQITYIRDLTASYDSSNPPTFLPDLPVDPTAHMISFSLGSDDPHDAGDGIRVTGTIRTSGTEPKIKYYLEGSGMDPVVLKRKLEEVRAALGSDWLRAEEFGLESA